MIPDKPTDVLTSNGPAAAYRVFPELAGPLSASPAWNVRTNRLGLPLYFASAIKLAKIWYEPRRLSCWRCAGLSFHRRPRARLESRRKLQLDSNTGLYKQRSLFIAHRFSALDPAAG